MRVLSFECYLQYNVKYNPVEILLTLDLPEGKFNEFKDGLKKLNRTYCLPTRVLFLDIF